MIGSVLLSAISSGALADATPRRIPAASTPCARRWGRFRHFHKTDSADGFLRLRRKIR
jgi:hypothetical protein